MPTKPLNGCRILIVEDEYFIAADLKSWIEEAGGTVLGPFNTVARCLEEIELHQPDISILDVNIRGEPVYRVAAELADRNIPFLFATGYDFFAMHPQWSHIERWEKPYDRRSMIEALKRLAEARPSRQ